MSMLAFPTGTIWLRHTLAANFGFENWKFAAISQNLRGYLKNHCCNTRLVCTHFITFIMLNPNMAMKIWILYIFDVSSGIDISIQKVNECKLFAEAVLLPHGRRKYGIFIKMCFVFVVIVVVCCQLCCKDHLIDFCCHSVCVYGWRYSSTNKSNLRYNAMTDFHQTWYVGSAGYKYYPHCLSSLSVHIEKLICSVCSDWLITKEAKYQESCTRGKIDVAASAKTFQFSKSIYINMSHTSFCHGIVVFRLGQFEVEHY